METVFVEAGTSASKSHWRRCTMSYRLPSGEFCLLCHRKIGPSRVLSPVPSSNREYMSNRGYCCYVVCLARRQEMPIGITHLFTYIPKDSCIDSEGYTGQLSNVPTTLTFWPLEKIIHGMGTEECKVCTSACISIFINVFIPRS